MCISFRFYLLISIALVCLFHARAYAELKLTGVEGELLESLSIYKDEIDYPVDESLSSLGLIQYQTALEKNLNKGLSAFGYFSPKYTYSTDVPEFWLARQIELSIDKGPQTKVVSFELVSDLKQGKDTSLPKDLNDLLEQAHNAIFEQALLSTPYESYKMNIQSKALALGYFDFEFVDTQIDVNSQQSTADIKWQIAFGSRYQFGQLDFTKDERGAALVKSVKNFKQGDWFTQEKLAKFTQRVRQTGYFDSVIVRPNVQNRIAIEDSYQVPIELILKSKPKDSFRFGAGFSTDTGPRATVNWQRPWINLRGHSLVASAYVSKELQSVDLSYNVPMANPLNDFFRFQVGVRQVNENQTESTKYTLAVQRQLGAKEDDDWNKVLFVRYLGEEFSQGFQEQQSTQLLTPGISFNRIRKNDEIFVSSGDRQILTVEGSSSSLLSDIDLFKLTLNTKWIRTYDRHRLIARADLGAMVTDDFEQVPASLRYFAGGDQSIRGFGLNEVTDTVFSEEEQEIELVGGKFLNVASIEYAYALTDSWRGALFLDAGGAGEEFADRIAYGFGAGVHWLSPVGTIRLYLARGKNQEERTWRIHFNIGPGV